MKTKLLDLQMLRCPDVMIMTRRFLSTELSQHSACEIITCEPSAMRDVPFYCNYEELYLESKEVMPDGRFRFVVMQSKPVVKTEQVIELVDTTSIKAQRDAHLHSRYMQLVEDLKNLSRASFLPVYPCSFGKDSSVVLSAGLQAHRELMDEAGSGIDHNTPFVVIHIDTGVEVVPMTMYSNFAMNRLRVYCQQQGINLELHHKTPPIHQQFSSLFIGARKLPSTPAMNSDCAVIWKVDQSEAIQRELIKRFGGQKVVSCLGSRSAESASRAASLVKHGNTQRTVANLIKDNKKGIQTFAPIIDWTNEEVFELLARIGTSPLTAVRSVHAMPTYVPSYRLLIQIYGDSANDTCEINLGEHKSTQAGCGGAARNGCHTCFKVGPTDNAAVAHNANVRWGNIQGNATKVRDYVYSIAHSVAHRTHHPRTFDPITNHVMMQPNILNSRTLERILTYYVQLTQDDYVRSVRFADLVRAGEEMNDPGFAEIANDTSMDPQTRREFMAMYKECAQQHLIKVATLEHCILLSAQWAMDGVKSAPFRPLAIYHSIVNLSKRIPYPATPTHFPNDTIGDAVAFPLCEPGIDLLSQWVPPARPWDIMEADRASGCSTDTHVNTQRISVDYNPRRKPALVTKANGRICTVVGNTRKAIIEQAKNKADENGTAYFTAFLTYRDSGSLGQRLTDSELSRSKIADATRRSRKLKDGKAADIGRTSLHMYSAKPTSSLESANTQSVDVWVPSFTTKRTPLISQHTELNEAAEANFILDGLAIDDWLQFGGFEEAIRVHDEYISRFRNDKRTDNGRYTVRRFAGTSAFWTLMQSGLITVNSTTYKVCQRILQRTELFHEAGLFDFSDFAESIISHVKCKTMTQHRSFKAKQLLVIRKQRNASRADIKARLALKDDAMFLAESLAQRIDKFSELRTQYCGTQVVDCKLMIAAGTTGFDHLNYSVIANIADDWLADYSPAFESVQAFVARFGNRAEKALIAENVAVRKTLNVKLKMLNNAFAKDNALQLNKWVGYLSEAATISQGVKSTSVTHSEAMPGVKALANEFQDIFFGFNYTGLFVTHTLTRTATRIMSDAYLSDTHFDTRIANTYRTLSLLQRENSALLSDIAAHDIIGTLSPKARSQAILAL